MQSWLVRIACMHVCVLLLVGVIGFQLFLQGQDLLIPLIQPPRQRYHDVPLLQQQVFVPVNLQTRRACVSSKCWWQYRRMLQGPCHW